MNQKKGALRNTQYVVDSKKKKKKGGVGIVQHVSKN